MAEKPDVEQLLDLFCGLATVGELLCAIRGRKQPAPEKLFRGEAVREITEHVRQRWMDQT